MFNIKEEAVKFNGKIFITDPCYVIPEELWPQFCNQFYNTIFKTSIKEGNGNKRDKSYGFYFNKLRCAVVSTNSGDGCFSGKNIKGKIGVDSGLIAVFPYKCIDHEAYKNLQVEQCAAIANITRASTIKVNNGDFEINNVQIHTGGGFSEPFDEDKDETLYQEDIDYVPD